MFTVHKRHVYLIILELNSGVYLSLCEYVMFMLTHYLYKGRNSRCDWKTALRRKTCSLREKSYCKSQCVQ